MNGSGLQTTTYTANLLNQYTAIGTPAVASVNGLANRTNTVTVNSAATVRQGEYWWKETTVNNASTPVWASLNVAASNGGSTNSTVNRYVHKASEVPSHDEDGNQTGDGRWHYRWDAENRLVEMETTTAATGAGAPYAKVRWTYDPLGRRIQRQSWQGANPVVVTKYVYDGWQCIAEMDGSNVVTATYAWGKDLSGSRTGAGGVGGLLWVHHAQHGRHFYAYDGNGNVCGLTSATDGTRSGGYEYDPFGGVIRVDAGNPVVSWNEWQFSTKRKDGVAEVVLYEYRGYDVRTGRWLSRDPIEERASENLYTFVDNDSLSYVDILGLRECKPIERWNVRYDFDSEKLPRPPIPGIHIDGRLRVEIQLSRLDCKVCCSGGASGWESEVNVRGFVRAGVTILYGIKGGGSLGGSLAVDFWAGIRGELAGQGEVNARFTESDCRKTEGVDICFGVRLFGRLSIGGQGRLRLGRWGIGTVELTGNAELSNLNQVCISEMHQGRLC